MAHVASAAPPRRSSGAEEPAAPPVHTTMATTRLNGVLQHLAQPAAAEGSALKVSVNTDKVPRLLCSPPHPTSHLGCAARGR